MGIGFVAIAWVVIILICQVLLSPLTVIGFIKYKKSKIKKWLILCIPAISLLVLPIAVVILIGISIILGDHGPINRPLEKDVYGKYYLTDKSRDH
ncbi:MAG: hypothetical protein LLG40_02690 [Deltaproteobacteria bacterium]|nr:hypothetical protein [Deltaproteobacteria bacterium]